MFRANAFGCDATHWAGARGSVKVLAWLARHGFDLGLANDQGHAALDKARFKGHAAAVTWLEDHLATRKDLGV